MSDEFGREPDEADGPAPAAHRGVETTAPTVPPTGHAGVDEVLASLEGLESTPVADQVPVFEAAHETLRSALADAGNDNPPA